MRAAALGLARHRAWKRLAQSSLYAQPAAAEALSISNGSLQSVYRSIFADSCDSQAGPANSVLTRSFATRTRVSGAEAAAIARAVRDRRKGLTAVEAPGELVPQITNNFEREVAPIFSGAALVVTRTIEWGQVILGFEQAQKYTVFDESGRTVAYMAEEIGTIGQSIGRQLLRNNRAFTVTVMDANGVVLFRVKRPVYFINSSITIENGAEEVVGEVHQRWHLWKRNYDLYLGKQQFAAVRGGFLAWEFELQDDSGRPLAKIDRNFSGFGKELFTDAGTYVVHFATALSGGYAPVTEAAPAAVTPGPSVAAPPQGAAPSSSGPPAVHGADTWQPPALARPLALTERAVALATAISVDYDYFSRSSGGFDMPFFMPGGGSEEGAPAPDAQTAQAAAHDQMMEEQKSGGAGGAMGAVGLDQMSRGGGGDGAEAAAGSERVGRDAAGAGAEPAATEQGHSGDSFFSGWGEKGDDDDDGEGGGGLLGGFMSDVFSGGDLGD